MSIDLAASLPLLLPRAVAWAEAQADAVLASGVPLESSGLQLARGVGVRNPANVRIGVVDLLPLPDDASLREAALQAALLGPG
jgi:2-methylisocitrate lyase-like PEP mutase family enzyme